MRACHDRGTETIRFVGVSKRWIESTEAEEPCGVRGNQLFAVPRRYPGEELVQRLLRLDSHRDGVREVGAPHHLVDSDLRDRGDSALFVHQTVPDAGPDVIAC